MPLVIKLRDGASPVRMSARKNAPPQLKFMREKIRELEELGLVHVGVKDCYCEVCRVQCWALLYLNTVQLCKQ
jgi:hypothetical protein